jgi:phosphate-selective porin OprO/OprP
MRHLWLCVALVASALGETATVAYATLYENEDNRYMQKFALSGRVQPEAAWFEAEQGEFADEFLWRRFRFGFKSDLFREWVLHIEGDFDLDESLGSMYTRLTDAYIGWSPAENLDLKILKQSVGFTLDGATSSKRLPTMQRNDLTNNLWFTGEYFTGIGAKGKINEQWSYNAGIFSSDDHDELSRFEAAYFTLLSVGYHFTETPNLDNGLIRVDYVYNEEDINSGTRDFSQVLSLVTKWQAGPWGLWTDLSGGKGYAGQSDVWGLVFMPFYDFSPRYQIILRYTLVSSADENGVRLPRYEGRIVDGRGDRYNEIYLGFNVYFYGHKFKWQTGLEYSVMQDAANDGGEYRGYGLNTGLRFYW